MSLISYGNWRSPERFQASGLQAARFSQSPAIHSPVQSRDPGQTARALAGLIGPNGIAPHVAHRRVSPLAGAQILYQCPQPRTLSLKGRREALQEAALRARFQILVYNVRFITCIATQSTAYRNFNRFRCIRQVQLRASQLSIGRP